MDLLALCASIAPPPRDTCRLRLLVAVGPDTTAELRAGDKSIRESRAGTPSTQATFPSLAKVRIGGATMCLRHSSIAWALTFGLIFGAPLLGRAGNVFLSGHDPDFHALLGSNASGAQD